MYKRQSGVLLPVFSLPGPYGCGCFGESAFHWIDKIKEAGFSIWQVLPFGMTDDNNSPYMSYSSFGGNPFFIDPDALYDQGLVTLEELRSQMVDYPYLCRYGILNDSRIGFLKKAASRVKDHAPIRKFMKENPFIDGTCRFLALKEKNSGKKWNEWDDTEPDREEYFAWQFIQYEFHREWALVHDYAKRKGITVIGDLPFYVSPDSFDVWSSPDQFQLDEKHDPTDVAGVPPDYFAKDGQLWGNPLYNWEKMEKNGFAWWKKRLGYMLSLFDGIRIDHFRAVSAYWKVPAGEKTAKNGHWAPGPGRKLIDAFREFEGEKLILAEDLGIIDDGTREILKYSGYPGMAVIQFGFGDKPDSPHLPHNYRENLIAYTGTHDNDTFTGFFWHGDDEMRRTVLDYLGDPKDPARGAVRTLMMSPARIVVFPLQDLLGFGSDTRINTPGTADGNWQYRVTRGQMDSLDTKGLAHMNHIYARD